MTNNSSKITYYKARDEVQVNELPFFFGWVEFVDEKIKGEHYKPKLEQATEMHIVGYYKIEGLTRDFLQSFEQHGLIEITQEDFNTVLSKWTQGGTYPPTCWGMGLVWEIAKPSSSQESTPAD